jgi:broad specificity phosphatase PhoE
MTINLYLVRHGQTLFNKEYRMQGSCDSALTPLGVKQIEATRDYFAQNGIAFDRAYCSTQERASDTLEIIAGPEMEYDRLKELKEKDYGIYEGRNILLWPFRRLVGSSTIEDDREVTERMERGMNLILRDAQDGENILVVGHGDSMGHYIRERAGGNKFPGFHNAEFALLQSDGNEVEYEENVWPAKNVRIDQITGN